MQFKGKVQSLDFDYFNRKEVIAEVEGGYRVHLYHHKSGGQYDVIDIYKRGEKIFSRDIYPHQKYEYIHFIQNRVKSRFFVYTNNAGHLHELIIPHDLGKICVLKAV